MQPKVIRLRGGLIAILALTATTACAVPLRAQAPAGDSSPVTVPYRTPQIALAEPVSGANVPQDNPAIVLRFARGEPDDPLDLSTFEVAVDGATRTPQFRIDSTEAWGSLDPPARGQSEANTRALALGIHQLSARICSTHGICADVRASVTVAAPWFAVGDSTSKIKHRSELVVVIALVLAFIRKLITR